MPTPPPRTVTEPLNGNDIVCMLWVTRTECLTSQEFESHADVAVPGSWLDAYITGGDGLSEALVRRGVRILVARENL